MSDEILPKNKMSSRFTPEQLKVINSPLQSHAKVMAVAGAGKTSTLIARVKKLISQGVSPSSIAVFMFNKSAQEEFSSRLINAMSDSTGATFKLDVMTFHSFGMKLTQGLERANLIERAQLVTNDFSLIKLLRDAVQQLKNISSQSLSYGDDKDWLEDALLFVDQVKASTKTATDVFAEGDWSTERSFFPDLYRELETLRKKQKIRFFSDLIQDPLCFFLDNVSSMSEQAQKILPQIIPNYKYILVDEFQDINESQYELLKCLYYSDCFWMMVGDVQQCIYEWRGANPNIMSNQIDTDFIGLNNYALSQSFRFGHQIGMMATNLLAHNNSNTLVIGNEENTECVFTESERVGKALLVELKRWRRLHNTLSNGVVLVRLYSDMVPIQLALMHKRIPYQLHGDSPLLENRQVRMLMSYIAVMAGGLESPDLFYNKQDIAYLITTPSLGLESSQQKVVKEQAIRSPHLIPQLLESIANTSSGWRAKKINERADWLRSLSLYAKQPEKGLSETIERLNIYRYFENTSSKDIQFDEKVATCDAFISYVEGVKLSAQEILFELKTLADNSVSINKNEQAHGLHLMSLHKSKGLEFDLVIMVGLREGRFPYYESGEQAPVKIEAERRLFYVGITRAKQRLVLLAKPNERDQKRLNSASLPDAKESTLSRFVLESQPILCQKVLAREALEVEDIAQVNKYIDRAHLQIAAPVIQKKSSVSRQLKPGEKVRHEQFGEGTIVRQETTGKRMIFVEFEEVGFKRFNPEHTKLLRDESS